MGMIKYTDQEIEEFLELAQDLGIGRAIRVLGYPTSWGTAQRWAKNRNITVAVDELRAKSKEYHDWYTTEDALLVAQQGMSRVYDELMESRLTPDELKKLAESFQKYTNTWMLLQGKATSVSETRETDSISVELLELINEQRAKNNVNEVQT